jgi:hypothetical protein
MSGLRGGRPGFESRQSRIILFYTASTQPSIKLVTRASLSGIKRPGLEANSSPSSSAKIMNAWSCTSRPSYVWLNHHGQFHIYLVISLYPVPFLFFFLFSTSLPASCFSFPNVVILTLFRFFPSINILLQSSHIFHSDLLLLGIRVNMRSNPFDGILVHCSACVIVYIDIYVYIDSPKGLKTSS